VRGWDVVASGHSHRPRIETIDGVLYLNPGSAGPRRFNLPVTLATLELTARALRPLIHDLGGEGVGTRYRYAGQQACITRERLQQLTPKPRAFLPLVTSTALARACQSPHAASIASVWNVRSPPQLVFL